ncbi:glycosyl hydrolase family 28-related protein [Pedobacter immunditicola]|uniref:glycosyl hydrolase family 28-related protein n=1 Tax=Pedobacter immunditicola TaxID=3133440 RepID=UPI00309E92FD
MKAIYLTLFLLFQTAALVLGQYKTVNVKSYGAKGDGKSNDYPALKKAVAQINAQKGGLLYFPPGTYYLDVYHQGKKSVDTTDLEFKYCDGLRIYGEKATIAVKGDIHRKVTRKNANHTFSSITAITPIKLSYCKNVTIEGLTLDGNVDQMSKDKKVNESGGHLIFINRSENVKLKNLNIHHAQTDGIYIRNHSKNVTGENLVSSNNARQGMSIIQLEKGVFNNCKFINTGITGGKYGRHAPSGGVDIEPNRQTERVVDIQFNNCTFANNRGPQLLVSHPATSRQIVLRSCKFVADKNSNRLGVLVNAKEVLFEDCHFDLGKANIYPARKAGTSSVFRNCVIRSSSSGFIAVNKGTERSVVIDRCTLEYTGKAKISSYFPYINMTNMVFTNNTIKVPSQYYKASGVSGMVMNSKKVSGNKYQSNGREVQRQLSVKGSRVTN